MTNPIPTSRSSRVAVAALLLALPILAGRAAAQDAEAPTRKIISIGNYPRVDGLRINFLDRDLQRVRGINLTVWRPQRGTSTGTVSGLALGVPITGVGDLRGIGVAAGGLGATGDVQGITVAGLGAGAGGTLSGISVGGIGVGAGGDVRGIAVGGIGVGAGGRVTGLAVGGVGVGAGGTLHGLAIGGLGVGAPTVEGVAIAPMVGGEEIRGIVIAPVLFRTSDGGALTGGSLSAVNAVRGHQHGLTIGIVNFAHSLNGVQLGAVNIVTGNPSARRVLPIINWGGAR